MADQNANSTQKPPVGVGSTETKTYVPVKAKVEYVSKNVRQLEDGSTITSHRYAIKEIDPKSGITTAMCNLFGRADGPYGQTMFSSSRLVGGKGREIETELVFTPITEGLNAGLHRVVFAVSEEEKAETLALEQKAANVFKKAAAFGVSRQMVQMQIAQEIVKQELTSLLA